MAALISIVNVSTHYTINIRSLINIITNVLPTRFWVYCRAAIYVGYIGLGIIVNLSAIHLPIRVTGTKATSSLTLKTLHTTLIISPELNEVVGYDP
jgi:hypothetical protein